MVPELCGMFGLKSVHVMPEMAEGFAVLLGTHLALGPRQQECGSLASSGGLLACSLHLCSQEDMGCARVCIQPLVSEADWRGAGKTGRRGMCEAPVLPFLASPLPHLPMGPRYLIGSEETKTQPRTCRMGRLFWKGC